MEILRYPRPLSQALLRSKIKLVRHLSYPGTTNPVDSFPYHKNADAPEPPSAPPWRQNLDLDFSTPRRPITVGGARFNVKHILARRKRCIAGQALSAGYFIPSRLKPLKLVAVTGTIRGGITKGREFDRKIVLIMRKYQMECDGAVQTIERPNPDCP